MALLRATGRGIRRVDPGAEIVTAGLPDSRLGVPLRQYVAAMYEAGGAGAFDALAVNPYGLDATGVLDTVEAGAPGRGHATATTPRSGSPSWAGRPAGRRARSSSARRTRRELLEQTLLALARRRDALRIRGVVYFNWRDSTPYAGGRDFFGLHTGLLRLRGSAKPALAAYKKVAETLGLLPH